MWSAICAVLRFPALSDQSPAQHSRRPSGTSAMVAAMVAVFTSIGVAGCGTNIDALLAQTANAAATTTLDIILTQFANQAADALDRDAAGMPADGDGGDGDGDGGDGGGAGDGGGGAGDGGGGGGGDPGQAAYSANGCPACHGDSGEGGTGPALAGVDKTAELGDRFGGGTQHFGNTLTEQEITDVAAWLLGGSGSGGGGSAGDADAGAATFQSVGCAACHCSDASGGCALAAPALSGVGGATLDPKVRGDAPHVGGKFNLSDQDIADLEAYLGTV